MPVEDLSSHANRGLRAELPTSYPTYVDRWAIVVGISKYKDESINLKYADRDAEALYELLLNPSGGGFEKDHIELLTNEKATTANITRALRSFLKKPAKDDIVLLYFACHGGPDIDRPDILYLITHDADPTDISGTALPMREINMSLRENLLAQRVIIIADTCHSGGIGRAGTRDAGNNSGAINLYFEEVGKAKKGVALLTSAEANQVSFEEEKWGGGHGAFTHYILEGMRGAADRDPHNGIVTVGELFEYVRENVKLATNNKQHPCVGPDIFDRNLPIAITAGISAHEHYELGWQLYQLGMKLDERGTLLSSSRHLHEAIRLARITGLNFTEAHLKLGLALMHAGELTKAIEVFEVAAKASIPDAAYYLGIVYAKQGKAEKSVQVLELFLKQYPQDKKALWVQEFIWQQRRQYAGAKYGLLIGIDDYPSASGFTPLKGSLNDVQLIHELLVGQYAFPSENINVLTDSNATYDKILLALQQLASKATPNDIIVIHFSGHSIEPIEYKHYLVAYDSVTPFHNGTGRDSCKSVDENLFSKIVTVQQLHDCVNSIPGNKTLILDTHANQNFIDLAKTGNYTLLLATSPGLQAYERRIDEKRYGYFTYSLVEQLHQLTDKAKIGQTLELVTDRIQSLGGKQLPIFSGDREAPFFASHNYLLDYFTFSQRQNYSAFTEKQLEQQYDTVARQLNFPFPELYQSLGEAFLEKGNYEKAVSSFQVALEQSQQNHSDILFVLGTAQFLAGKYDVARETFQQYLKLDSSRIHAAKIQDVLSRLEQLRVPKHNALLVGVNNYFDSAVPKLHGAVNDVWALKEVLVNKHHFQEANITILLDNDATCENILKCFKELVAISKNTPALFYFAGNGSLSNDGNLTILGVDSRQNNIYDITLNELGGIVGEQETNLTTIIDAGWANAISCPANERVAPPDSRALLGKHALIATSVKSSHRQELDSGLINIRDLSGVNLQIGCVSIYSESIKFGLYEKSDEIQGEKEFTPSVDRERKNIHGILTYALLETLQEIEVNTTYTSMIESISKKFKSQPFVVGTDLSAQFLKDFFRERSICSSLKEVEQESLKQAAMLIEQRNDFDSERALNLGVIYYVLGEFEKSFVVLESTLAKVSEQSSKTANQRLAEQVYPLIHYWLGRVLYDSNCDPARAVSGLRLATKCDPTNIAAHYYLGQALRSLMKQEFLTEAEEAFQTYLNSGAPLGQESEVRDFLRSFREAKSNHS